MIWRGAHTVCLGMGLRHCVIARAWSELKLQLMAALVHGLGGEEGFWIRYTVALTCMFFWTCPSLAVAQVSENASVSELLGIDA